MTIAGLLRSLRLERELTKCLEVAYLSPLWDQKQPTLSACGASELCQLQTSRRAGPIALAVSLIYRRVSPIRLYHMQRQSWICRLGSLTRTKYERANDFLIRRQRRAPTKYEPGHRSQDATELGIWLNLT